MFYLLHCHPQHKELLFQRYQSSFINTLEIGRQLFSMGDEETQTQLQTDLGTLQEEWDNLHSLLSKRLELTEAIIKNWERYEAGLTDSMLQLKDMKTQLNQTMPEFDDNLESAKLYKVHLQITNRKKTGGASLASLFERKLQQ